MHRMVVSPLVGVWLLKIRVHADFKYQVLHGQNLTTIFYAAVHGWQTIFTVGVWGQTAESVSPTALRIHATGFRAGRTLFCVHPCTLGVRPQNHAPHGFVPQWG